MLPENQHADFGFGIYSARYGNVYSIRQLLQLVKRASGDTETQEPFWEKDGRFYDPYRPTIQKSGFANLEEAHRERDFHLSCISSLLEQTDLFIFTFGLTEAWVDIASGAIFPTCPGVIAGEFDANKHAFHNFSFSEVLADTKEFIEISRSYKSDIRFIFTVSPVPLTATASGHHVLVASTYSKSVLRAVCGELTSKYTFVDYFPSFELISSHPMRGMFYQPNLRAVSQAGVDLVMEHFFKSHVPPQIDDLAVSVQFNDTRHEDDIVCEEIILEEFGE